MSFDDSQYLTVAELNAQVRELLEEEYADVGVIGEVSNLKRHSSGHCYFRLKDSDAQIDAVIFRREAERVDFDLEDGMKVLATGRVTVYEPWGRYQLVAHAIEQTGTGELEIAFRKLKERLAKEGLFDAEHKKELPRYPFKAAVVTSPTGAAVRDIVSTFRRRWPALEILVCPVNVQGDQAIGDIARALQRLEDVDDLDVIIVGRGGGSLEDLWAFNEEVVARAIFECSVPIISAVGHETDFTIADFVADKRAATPTMAAEIASPRADEISGDINRMITRLVTDMRSRLDINSGRLEQSLRSYALGQVRGRIEQSMQAGDFALERLIRHARDIMAARRTRVGELMTRLSDLDATAILKRGYTICADNTSGHILRSVDAARRADGMKVSFHDGDVLANVVKEVRK
jgi:exodeoxyribonuclease VII large subunit